MNPDQRRSGSDTNDLSQVTGPAGFGATVLTGLGKGLLRFAEFAGLIIRTSIDDMAHGFFEGGELRCDRVTQNYRGEESVPLIVIKNDLASCLYRVSSVMNGGKDEIRETLDLVRNDLPGGAILNFTNGDLVHGVTNGVFRNFFSPEERASADKLLRAVRLLAEER